MSTAKIILITGANKGVGYGSVIALAEAGHTVLMGSRDERRGTDAAEALRNRGLDVHVVSLDVTVAASVVAAACWIDEKYGRLDVLINNAGIARDRPHLPTELPVENMREVYETNVFGVVTVTNTMLPLLRRSDAGYIGNVSSGLGTIALLSDFDSDMWQYANLLAYNSSKAALNAVTLIYARTLRDDGITVNALSPGYVATDLNKHSGPLTIEESGRYVAEQVQRADGMTGAFLNETGGTYPW